MTAMRTMFMPFLNRTVRIGGRRCQPRGNKLHFRHYVNKLNLPAPPAACDYSAAALAVLRDIMGNDVEGDCVYAAHYHYVGVVTGNAGALFHATLKQINADYSATEGYVPGDPSTDNGADPKTVDDYYVTHGYANGTKAAGYLYLDPSNPAEIMTAISLFEGCILGGPLADEWINPFPSGDNFVWGPGNWDQSAGHEVECHGYDKVKGLRIDTWTLFGWITWAAVAGFCSNANGGDLCLILTQDILNKASQKSPGGLNWALLCSDFNALGGNVVVPPTPPPVPPPVPDPPPVVPPVPDPPPVVPPPVVPVGMKLVSGVSGERIVDTYAVVRADSAIKLKASGVDGIIRYLDNLTQTELQGLLAAGLKVGFVSSCRRTGWIPTAAMGKLDGTAAVAKLKALGIPAGPHAFADCEGMGGTGQGLIDYLDARGTVIKAAGYRHAEYEGWGHKSNPYASKQTNGYWAALSIAEPRPQCGWLMAQLMPGNVSRCGVVVDLNFVQQDQWGRLPMFIAVSTSAEPAANPDPDSDSDGRQGLGSPV